MPIAPNAYRHLPVISEAAIDAAIDAGQLHYVLCPVLADEPTPPAPDATTGQCFCCSADVWLSPSANVRLTPLCMRCAIDILGAQKQ